jgi:hypothetical protein
MQDKSFTEIPAAAAHAIDLAKTSSTARVVTPTEVLSDRSVQSSALPTLSGSVPNRLRL